MTGVPTVVIASAGRRLYLVDWFREAFASLGIEGRVVVTEHDPTSAAASYGDVARTMPAYSDPAYAGALLDLVDELQPRLLVSVNDYELLHLHVRTDLGAELRGRGVLVPGVSPAWQSACADKLAMAYQLSGIGVPSPATFPSGDRAGLAELVGRVDEVVVKHRFGSGSSGLAIVPAGRVEEAIAAAVRSAPSAHGARPTADDVIVQPRVSGVEHGVDIVGDLREEGHLRAVLARRKLRMRAGETDKAVTVEPTPFVEAAERIARSSGLTGLIDVDMFLDEDGSVSVIDINPRFGGGYPFVHLAGADVPRFYLQQALGLAPEDETWKDCVPGVLSAKHESVRVTAREG